MGYEPSVWYNIPAISQGTWTTIDEGQCQETTQGLWPDRGPDPPWNRSGGQSVYIGWGPPSDVCWFINPEIIPMNTIVISTINHCDYGQVPFLWDNLWK
jgi:hypothetical protein